MITVVDNTTVNMGNTAWQCMKTLPEEHLLVYVGATVPCCHARSVRQCAEKHKCVDMEKLESGNLCTRDGYLPCHLDSETSSAYQHSPCNTQETKL